jgi:hypothetical protein
MASPTRRVSTGAASSRPTKPKAPKYPPVPGAPLTNEVRLFHHQVPTSVNDLYIPIGSGMKRRSREADLWFNSFLACRGGLSLGELSKLNLDPCHPYDLSVTIISPHELWLTNEAAKRHTGSLLDVFRTGAHHPFRRNDVSNCVKITEDAVSDLMGVDDRNNWNVHAYKRVSPLPSRHGVYVRLVRMGDFTDIPAHLEPFSGWSTVINDPA